MRIGITFDLRSEYLAAGFSDEETAEFDRESTIDAIDGALRAHGHSTDRIGNVWQLTRRLAAGDRWDLVFNIAEGLRGYGREAQVPALLDAYGIPYTFSDPLVMSLTLHKSLTKRVARDHGFATAPFALVERESDVARVDLPYPLFVKPVAEGTSKGVTRESKVTRREDLLPACRALLAQFRQPVLVETYLPGREFTVGLLGTGADTTVVGVLEVVFKQGADQDSYSYFNKANYKDIIEYRVATDALAQETARLARDVWVAFDCRDGGRVDVRVDAQGAPNLMEVGALAGLHPEHSDLAILSTAVGIPYHELIGRITESALKRVAAAPPPPRALLAGTAARTSPAGAQH